MIATPLYDKFFPRPDFLVEYDIKTHQKHLKKMSNRYKLQKLDDSGGSGFPAQFKVSKISQGGFKVGEMAIIGSLRSDG